VLNGGIVRSSTNSSFLWSCSTVESVEQSQTLLKVLVPSRAPWERDHRARRGRMTKISIQRRMSYSSPPHPQRTIFCSRSCA